MGEFLNLWRFSPVYIIEEPTRSSCEIRSSVVVHGTFDLSQAVRKIDFNTSVRLMGVGGFHLGPLYPESR